VLKGAFDTERRIALEKESLYLDAQLDFAKTVLVTNVSSEQAESSSSQSLVVQKFVPCEKVGGDWIGVFHHPELKRRHLFLADVSGHGVGSAFAASLISGAVRFSEQDLRFQYANEGKPKAFDPHAYLENLALKLNFLMLDHVKGKSLTLIAASYHEETGELTLLSAGHPMPYLVEKKSCGLLDFHVLKTSAGSAVGLSLAPLFKAHTHCLMPGQGVVLYTDGMLEFQDPQGKLLTTASLKKHLNAIDPNSEPDQLLEEIYRKLNSLNPTNRSLPDDLAILMLLRNRESS
jgi:phosphoserine phosphatase RsbU/P